MRARFLLALCSLSLLPVVSFAQTGSETTPVPEGAPPAIVRDEPIVYAEPVTAEESIAREEAAPAQGEPVPTEQETLATQVAPPVMRHAPRALGITLGYAYTPRNELPLDPDGDHHTTMGLSVEGRYGWQVGGLDGGRPSWVGLGLSFSAFTRGAPRSSFDVDYGLFVRHVMIDGPRVRGFFAYGLGASQTFVRNVDGRGIGHLTALSLGVDVRIAPHMHATVELAYRFVILPSLETNLEPAHRYDFHALRLVAGLFFGR